MVRRSTGSALALALTLAITVAPEQAPERAPEQTPSRPSAAASPASSAFTFDANARTATFRVDDGGSLDQYLYRWSGPIDFAVDLDGMAPGPASLRLQVYDVDQAGAAECGPEVDVVSVNGRTLGTLAGADGQWSLDTFAVPAGALTDGINAFQVEIDTTGSGCWAVEVGWADLTLPFNVAHLSSDATGDADIRRGTSDDTIADRVWARAFDAAGAAGATTADDPIADAMANGGTFDYAYGIGAWPRRPSWSPTVEVFWSFDGLGGSGSAVATGWDGRLTVPTPRRTGVYTLTVTFRIVHDGTLLTTENVRHRVYVLLDQPVGGWSGPKTSVPRTAWLDRAFQFGAGGWTAPKIVLQTLMINIYRNPLGWAYTAKDQDTPESLIEGTGSKGECFTFRDVWLILARSVGIPASTVDYGRGGGQLFLTTDRPALDGNAAANVSRTNGPSRERWAFGTHGWGVYGGDRYDPTFGYTGPADAFLIDGVLCSWDGETTNDGGWICVETAPATGRYLVKPLTGKNTAGWPLYGYGPAPVPFRALAPGVPAPIGSSGVDADGNGQFERLRADVPVTAASGGDYTITATGPALGMGSLEPAGSSPATVVHLTAGTHTVPVYFGGAAIRADGPYAITVRVASPGGGVASGSYRTGPYRRDDFQRTLAVLGPVTDALDAGRIRVTVPITPTGRGPVSVTAQLFAGDVLLGSATGDVTLGTAARTVTLGFDTAPIWASGLDGPYQVRIEARDTFRTATATHVTAAYRAGNLPAPATGFDTITDAVRDGSLDVTAAVWSDRPRTVTLDAVLVTTGGATLATARATVAATPTPAPVTLTLDGRGIDADGPYDVVLTIPGELSRTHRTAAYPAAGFTRPAAVLRAPITDAVADTDADGHPDQLRVGATLETAGQVTLSGTLADATGRQVATASVTAGAGPATLAFDGGDLRASGRDGPYRLIDVRLDGVPQAVEHTTGVYRAADFRPGGRAYLDRITDRAVDDTGDGLFDRLTVEVPLHLPGPGYWQANARLLDDHGTEIGWASADASLPSGAQSLTLSFDGRLIAAHGAEGPYRVEAFSVYTDPDHPLTASYRTLAYRARAFAPGATILGHVTDGGHPVAGALISVGGQAYGYTNAAGAYRLALPSGGPARVEIVADPALAPWHILVGGVPRASGTAVTVPVPTGGTTTVDFRRDTPPQRPLPVTG